MFQDQRPSYQFVYFGPSADQDHVRQYEQLREREFVSDCSRHQPRQFVYGLQNPIPTDSSGAFHQEVAIAWGSLGRTQPLG